MTAKQLLLLALIGLVAVTVRAEEKKSEKDDDERMLKIEEKERSVSISSKKEEGNVETEYDYKFSVNGFPNIRLEFKTEVETNKSEIETETNFRFGLVKLVEIPEGSNETAFTSKTVTLLSGKGSAWSPIVKTESVENNATTYKFSSFKLFNNGKLNVTWETFVSNKNTLLEKRALSPKAVKFSLRVKGYEYTTTGNAKLAIVGVASSKTTVEDDAKDSETVTFGSGEFKWDNYVMAGANKVNLNYSRINTTMANADVDESDDDQKVNGETGSLMAWVLESDKPSEFYWDPTLSTEPSSAATAGFSALLVVVAAMLTMF